MIVTATKSGAEQNYARFAGMFAEAIGSLESDLDHDDSVSVQEAFVRASTNVQRFYDSEDRLATEHALLEDNGDGKGTPVTAFRGTRVIKQGKDGKQVDGSLASRTTIALSDDAPKLGDDALAKRDELEIALEQLRRQKGEMNTEAYDRELEAIMVPLAKLYEAAK